MRLFLLVKQSYWFLRNHQQNELENTRWCCLTYWYLSRLKDRKFMAYEKCAVIMIFVLFVAIGARTARGCGPVASEELSTRWTVNDNSTYSSTKGDELFAFRSNATDATNSQRLDSNGNHVNPSTNEGRRHRGHESKQKHKKHQRNHHRGNASPSISTAAFRAKSIQHAQLRTSPSVQRQSMSTSVERDPDDNNKEHSSGTTRAPIPHLLPSSTMELPSASHLMATSRAQRNESFRGSSNTTAEDPSPCELWERCSINQDILVRRWLQDLPNCPCVYPRELYYNDTLFDPHLNKTFKWRVVSRAVDKFTSLKWTAVRCIRQQITSASTSIAAQVCCYDNDMKLITRGVGAGTPYLVSPEVSDKLHEKVDVLPLFVCLGDWTRYHAVRPPNNGQNCTENPDDDEYGLQVKKAQEF